MHRRRVVASFIIVLALATSPASAQSLESEVNSDSNVRPASCETAVSGCAGCGASVIGTCSCVAGDCSAGHLGDIGPCGPGGSATGDCLPRCYSAPYTHTLYPNYCYGPCCQSKCCKTIFGEMAMDIRRLWLGRGSCGIGSGCSSSGLVGGGFLGRGYESGLGSPVGPLSKFGCGSSCSGDSIMESSCGCETAGCTGDCAVGPICTNPVLESSCGYETAGHSGGLLAGLFQGLRGGKSVGSGLPGGILETSCGCESIGCPGGISCGYDSVGGAVLESTCGCETVGCSGDCGFGTCSQDVVSSCTGGGILGSIGGLLFGAACKCESCTAGVGCDIEISCGVEDAGCASTTTKQPAGQLVSAEESLPSRFLPNRIFRKSKLSPKQQGIRFANQKASPGASKAENPIKRVRHDQPTGKPERFLKRND